LLTSSKKIVEDAYYHKYAVGSFNVPNMEILSAVLEVANKLNSPVIIQSSKREMQHGGAEYIAASVRRAAQKYRVPIALHLDHGDSLATVKEAIEAGYNSVHIDGSGLPLDQNIALTREVVAYAHKRGVSVEGEVGKVPTPKFEGEDKERSDLFTKPEEAKLFVEKTKVDFLAVAIGTAHGAYKGEAKLEIDRTKELNRQVKIPMVLHGGSMCPARQLHKVVFYGVSKININTELRLAFTEKIRDVLNANPKEYVPYNYLGPAKEDVKKVVEEKIRLFKSNGRVDKMPIFSITNI
jgi:fructose-bisphosphate aldolase, class II